MINALETLSSLRLQKSLNKGMNSLTQALERLSTGFKVNHARDDAAGYSIITDIETKIGSIDTIIQNAQMGIDLLSTAEGGLANINEILIRLRALAEQAANGTYSEASREAMQAEADALIEQIDNIKGITEYNGVNLFSSQSKTDTSTNSTSLSNIGRAFTPPFSLVSEAADAGISAVSYQSESSGDVPVLLSTIADSATLNANETRTVTIDGVEYTLRNRDTAAATITWSKDTDTGEVTFNGNYFTITAQNDVSHNIVLNGDYLFYNAGDMGDKVVVTSNSRTAYVYGGDGDDEVTSYGQINFYGYGGNDTLTASGTKPANFYGGDGDDVMNVDTTSTVFFYGGGGNDTANVSRSGYNNVKLYGGDGEDSFNIHAGNSVLVDGGSGTNSILDNGTNTIKANVPGANTFSVDFAAGETKTLTINGIEYVVENTSSAASFLYSVSDTGQIAFQSRNFRITGDASVSHNVKLSALGSYFYGSNKDDIIELAADGCNVFSGNGNDTIIITRGYSYVVAGNGDNTIQVNYRNNTIIAGDGNNVININSGGNNYFTLGDGDNTFTVSGAPQYSGIAAGSGNNTITGDTSGFMLSGFGAQDNASAVFFDADETKTILINGTEYTLSSRTANMTNKLSMLYYYNPVTGVLEFCSGQLNITGQNDKAHNVHLTGTDCTFYGGELDDTIVSSAYDARIYGYGGNDTITINRGDSIVYGGDGDDTIVLNYGSNVNAGDGNDTITVNANATFYGVRGDVGDDTYNIYANCNPNDTGGNNTYNIYTNNSTISGSTGNDTFYIYGDNNQINGNGSSDYFVIDGNNNLLIGTSDTNSYYVDNGTGNRFQLISPDPNAGILNFTYQGEVKTLILNGKTYTITNDNAGTNQLKYSLNPNTGVITLEGSVFTVDSASDEQAVLNIRGDNNVINGSNLNDTITVESGSNNTINGNDGNDTLTSNDINNSLLGGNGNDTLNLNSSSNLEINGNDGNDTINVSSSNNTNIRVDDDRVVVSGSDNAITAGDGNNTFRISGDSNTISAGNGDNRFSVASDGNTITAGSGNNIIGIDGDNNTLNADNASGNINIIGENNDVTTVSGDNNVVIEGSGNTFTSQIGDKDVEVNGSNNTLTTGSGSDSYTVSGDENIISTGDGGDRITVEGSTNQITTGNGNNTITLRGDSNMYNGGDGVDRITISGDLNIANGGGSNDAFIVARGDGNTVDGNDGDRNTLIDNGTNTIAYNVVDITPDPFTCVIQVGLDGSEHSRINISVSFNVFDFVVDLSTSESAAASLAAIDELITDVSGQIVDIGSQINRLESVINAQTSTQQNLVSSLSTYKDTDIAEESANFIRQQILLNASSTLFSSYNNLRRESVLSLIQGIRG